MIAYSAYRRGVRSPLRRYRTLRDVGFVVAGVALYLAVIGTMQYFDLQAQLEDSNQKLRKYSHMLAQCMNGGALYDSASGTAHFCEKVVSYNVK